MLVNNVLYKRMEIGGFEPPTYAVQKHHSEPTELNPRLFFFTLPLPNRHLFYTPPLLPFRFANRAKLGTPLPLMPLPYKALL